MVTKSICTSFFYIEEKKLNWLFSRFGPHFYVDRAVVMAVKDTDPSPFRPILRRWYEHLNEGCQNGTCRGCFHARLQLFVMTGSPPISCHALLAQFEMEKALEEEEKHAWDEDWKSEVGGVAQS
jgi:hypothetical protein